MAVFEIIVVLLLVGALLTMAARRTGMPYPAVLALAGALLALVPGAPRVMLDPALALVLFVAPVLLDASFDASLRDLRDNWRSVASLALGAVVLTIGVVALTARWLVPDMSWAAAIALGAIVAPPDAAAATAVLRQVRPPQRLLAILEGESLFNDASALLVYRLAVAAALGATASGWGVVPLLAVVTAGSVLLGVVLAAVVRSYHRRIEDAATAVLVQFLGTFIVWMLAERLHLSGIITIVVFGMVLGRITPAETPSRLRIPSFAVWEVAVFVLNVLAFILVGFQLGPILAALDPAGLARHVAFAAATCAAAIVARFAWVGVAEVVATWRARRGTAARKALSRPLGRAALVVAWCGMRGTVTLAAALALPRDFPHRDLILVAAFGVVVGTLVVQGLSLRALLGRLRLPDDGATEREAHLAREETARAALAVLASAPDDHELADLLRRRYQVRLRELTGAHAAGARPEEHAAAHAAEAALVHGAFRAQRERLLALRASDTIGDEAFHVVEQELDWAELNAQALLQGSGDGVATGTG